MQEFLEHRSLEQVLSDLRASYQRRPVAALADLIQKVEAEIALRDGTGETHDVVQAGKRPSTRTLSAA